MLTQTERRGYVQAEQDRRALLRRYDWDANARDKQRIPPGDWRAWLILAGRGFGKTRTGAETVRKWSYEAESIGLIGRTLSDVRELMVDGPSGLLHVFPPWERPEWIASRRLVRFPSGATGHVFTSDEPEMLRGPQHGKLWMDEAAAWVYPDTTWNMAMFGLRVPPSPQAVITTTPKPIPLIKTLLKRAAAWAGGEPSPDDIRLGRVVMSRGSTHENVANLDPAFLGEIMNAYEGTRLGRQEIDAEVLEDIAGSLWKRADIQYRDPGMDADGAYNMSRIVVAIDPAATSGVTADETGIVAAGVGLDGLGYVMEDASLRGSPDEWGSAAVRLYHRLKADRIIAESNNGGEMVEHVIRTVDPGVPVTLVHASRGKKVRAEPVAAKYEQRRVFHVKPLTLLEDQMTSWLPITQGRESDILDVGSPDRVDALVWGLTHLFMDDPWGHGQSSAIG